MSAAMKSNVSVPVVLTIAGLDPSAGAGVLADARTIAAFSCYPTAVITSITFQNSEGVAGSVHQDPATVRGQLLPILEELPIACVKTGMLPTREVVMEVARIITAYEIQFLVVDPVMSSTSGYELMDQLAVDQLRSSLFPLATIITPNLPEAERLAGISIKDEAGMLEAAKTIRSLGVKAVLVKGGHLEKHDEVVDVLDNQGSVSILRGERVKGREFRGTGCALAAGISASLANGNSLEESIHQARDYVMKTMLRARNATSDPTILF
jgi:hydroxymethylpyrimidine/phosphomethylpyrimidine kinase